MQLVVTPFYCALLTILYFLLTYKVVKMRRGFRVGIGHGGNEQLKRAIRVHGNFAEYIPLALVLLIALELQGFGATWLHILGSLIFIGRILHSLGLSQKPGHSLSRFWGSCLTYLAMFISTIALMAGYIRYALNI